nr:T9SS type A sorting domain-containing protein [Candidatus Cloacimonadota bacterium]
VNTNQSDLSFNRLDGYDIILLERGTTTEVTGAPQLPIKEYKYLLPNDVKVQNIVINRSEKLELDGEYYIYPSQPPYPLNYSDPPPFVPPDDKIYNSDNPYPNKLVQIVQDYYPFGYHVVALQFYPVEYIPKKKKVFLYNEIDFTILYEKSGISTKIPERQSKTRYDRVKSYIKSLVKNPEDFDIAGYGGALQIIQGKNRTEKLRLSYLPGPNNNIVDYVVITNEELKPIFEDLIVWKTQKGLPAIVVTIEQIVGNYSGCDLAECIRNYLKDTYDKWGSGLYVLLGGDTEIIPARVGTKEQYSGGSYFRVTDMYYCDVYKPGEPDYNWNSNGDDKFGYDGDTLDLGPDNFIGRASVEDTLEARTFVNKILYYEKQNSSYVDNILLLGAYHRKDSWPVGQDMNNLVYNEQIPSDKFSYRLYDDYDQYEGDDELNRENVLNCMNNTDYSPGYFHIISHLDHGGPYNIGTSAKSKNQKIDRTDMDNLYNVPYYQIMFTGACDPNEFQKDCFAEHYINNLNGGGIAFIGNSGFGYPHNTERQCYALFKSIYHSPEGYRLGHAFASARDTMCSENTIKNLNLLGDPEMPIWTNISENLIVEVIPPEITNGENNVTVMISNLISDVEAMICLQKGNEDYAYQTVNGTGTQVSIDFVFTPDTPGQLNVTVTAHNYLPDETIIPVNITEGSHLYISETIFDDNNKWHSIGNADGQVDAGETIELSITLTNSGSSDALDVSAELTSDPDYITFMHSQSNFGDVSAGESESSQINYVFKVAPETPAEEHIQFNLSIQDGVGNSYTDEFYIQIGAPELEQVRNIIITADGDDIIETGETVSLYINLFNSGNAEATGITATLSSNSQYIESISESTQNYNNIPVLSSESNSQPFVFQVGSEYDSGDTLLFNLNVTNEYGKEWQFNFNLNKPAPVNYASIVFNSGQDEIDLSWEPIEGNEDDNYYIRGYNIYRSFAIEGTYEKLNTFIVERTSYYKDAEVEPVTSYFYKISTVSESGNESDLTEPYEAWTTLPCHAGWPVIADVGNSIHGSTNICDIDADGHKEIFNTIGGHILGFHSDGTELFDIDSNPTTISGFAELDKAICATPALGDIDNDGIIEVVVATRDDNYGKLYAYKTVDNDGDGKPDLLGGFPIALNSYYENIGVWRSPVLSDINRNGFLEIILTDCRGRVYVFDHTGASLPGWPINVNSSGSSYGMPAVVDLDGNGYKEIIVGCKNGLYIWNYDGSDYISNPFYENNWLVCPPVIVDLDNNDNYEILVISTLKDQTNPDYWHDGTYWGYVYALQHDGGLVEGWNASHPVRLSSDGESPHQPPAIAVGDLDEDMDIEVVVGGNEHLYIWDQQGDLLQDIEIHGLNVLSIAPVLADIDCNPDIEIVMASQNGKIYAYNFDGTRVAGWPLKTDDNIWVSPCVGDIDCDGKSELLVGNYSGKIYVWNTEGEPHKIQWGRYRNNSNNTGVYTTEHLYGDVDDNGVVQTYDARLALHYSADIITDWEDWRLWAADVDGNEEIMAYDAALVLQYSADIIDEFPVESGKNIRNDLGDVEITITQDGNILHISTSELLQEWGIISYQFNLEFDETVQYVNCDLSGSIFESGITAINDATPGILSVSYMSMYPVIGSGNILKLEFSAPASEYNVSDFYFNTTHFDVSSPIIPAVTRLEYNYPNPFDSKTKIQYSIHEDSPDYFRVELKIYNIKGQLVKTIKDEKPKGTHFAVWDCTDNNNKPACSGVFLYNLKINDNEIEIKKCLLLK